MNVAKKNGKIMNHYYDVAVMKSLGLFYLLNPLGMGGEEATV